MNELRDLIRRARTTRGMSQEQTGSAVHISGSAIGCFENGRMIPQPDTARAPDALFETGDEIQRLSAEARGEAIAPWLRPWTDNERRATLLRWFEPNLIPGLLQTESYARSVLGCGSRSVEQVEEMTEARLARQKATLDRSDPVTISAIIGEAAMRHGDPEVMKDQLDHLVRLGDRATMHIRVVTARTRFHVGLAGPFILATLPGAIRLGYLDDQLRGRVASDDQEVAELERTWEALSALALPIDPSRDLILKVINEYERTGLEKVQPQQ